jgi:hypothetical protein
MRIEKVFAELDRLNAQRIPVRGAYLEIFGDLVILREVSPSIYDRSVQAFDKEYAEAIEVRKKQETARRELRELKASLRPTPEATLKDIPEVAITRKNVEFQALVFKESRLVGEVAEAKLAPEYLKLFGFSRVKPHKRTNDPYDYTAFRKKFFYFIDVKSRKQNSPRLIQYLFKERPKEKLLSAVIAFLRGRSG